MKILALSLLSLLITLITFSSPVKALSCLAFESLDQELNKADLVFQGININKTPQEGQSIYTFKVNKVWKGTSFVNNAEVELYQREIEELWNYKFDIGKEYIIFARQDEEDNKLRLPLCGLSYDLTLTPEDENIVISSLGEGEDVSSSTLNSFSTDQLLVLISIVVTAVLLSAFYLRTNFKNKKL